MFSRSEWRRFRLLLLLLLRRRKHLRTQLGKWGRGRQGSILGADDVGIVFVAETTARGVAGDALNFVIVRERLLRANHHDSAMHPLNLARAARAAADWGVAGLRDDHAFGGSISRADGLLGFPWKWGWKLSVNRGRCEQENKRNEQ